MAIVTYTPKRPAYRVVKYCGIESIDDVCELVGIDEFTIEQQRGSRPILHIAGFTLKYQDLLVKGPDGTLSVRDGREFYREFEELK